MDGRSTQSLSRPFMPPSFCASQHILVSPPLSTLLSHAAVMLVVHHSCSHDVNFYSDHITLDSITIFFYNLNPFPAYIYVKLVPTKTCWCIVHLLHLVRDADRTTPHFHGINFSGSNLFYHRNLQNLQIYKMTMRLCYS